ncbi:protein FAM107B isoform X2 [Syngnathus scovelli]|uniref:protein FAM107B isoform X2 n=1 Tax=Syngnathus scovelli TaxID=161590 RepID=UPI00210FF8D7|nr:protein FAM107B isoform X2 [Syngnathus scovelli]XP_049610827.1 protein FAM107B isoform X2 [Syngnathus scovelli]XP_049610828.1 protein FAM107B isoform X2 [Syngnathus scovelli]XP_049610830.1 protein FAM107B isoform X2 [Syngnathus scovelli]XP_049610831.1 protein FAM107B isoform X2 [Syngnathus scovelli]
MCLGQTCTHIAALLVVIEATIMLRDSKSHWRTPATMSKKGGYGHHQKDTSLSLCAVDGSGDTQPRKLNGSSVEAPSYQNLHRELLLSHKRGLVLEEKPELKRVLEQRRLELHREQEMAQQRPSDLETELRKRQQKLQEYEQEEIRQKENQNKVPEFVRVKDNLRRTQMFMQ